MITKTEGKIKSGVLHSAGYLILLMQSVPAWTGLMTLPFASYLILMVTNFPLNLSRALADFLAPLMLLEKAFVLLGISILGYSILYLRTEKTDGLVVSGPYRVIRHPQYLGMILATLGCTSWCVWILTHTFGISFLSPIQTIGVWFLELCAYILLAYIEEWGLSRRYGEIFKRYRRQVPFFIPYLNTHRRDHELAFSMVIPVLLLCGLSAPSFLGL